ncbi:site-specific integrase [Nonomuraea zeae]|uniref:site-specific integrase n=1 Tax=Nonomuraea zeae TaxID=1642303 RepID=UPI0019816897|nr:site-specific integrase [Nonomuraea zeae]
MTTIRSEHFVSRLSGNSADVEAYRMDPVIAEQLGRAHPLTRHLDDFLTDLANAGASPHTLRAYRGDLIAFAAHHGEDIAQLTAMPIHAFLAELADLSPAASAGAPPSPPSPSGRSATTCCRPTRWTGSTPSKSRRPCPARPRPPASPRSSR